MRILFNVSIFWNRFVICTIWCFNYFFLFSISLYFHCIEQTQRYWVKQLLKRNTKGPWKAHYSVSRCSRNPAAGYRLFLQLRMWQGCFGDLVPRARWSKPKAGSLPSYATQTQQAELPKKGGGWLCSCHSMSQGFPNRALSLLSSKRKYLGNELSLWCCQDCTVAGFWLASGSKLS